MLQIYADLLASYNPNNVTGSQITSRHFIYLTEYKNNNVLDISVRLKM